MVKGLSRRVIVVDSPDPHIFEQAIFIVRNDAAVGSGGVTSQQVVDQAIRIAKDYARSHGAPPRRRLRMSPWLAALLGGAVIGAVATLPDYRGRGYASACVSTLAASLQKEGRRIYLSPKNAGAQRLYAGLGFVPCGEWGTLQRL